MPDATTSGPCSTRTPTRRPAPAGRLDAPPSRVVLYGVLGLALLSLLGAVIAVSGGLSPSVLDAMGPTGRLSIPLPMTLFQVAMAVAAGSRRRPLAVTGSAVVALALLLGVVSGFFDGGYGDERLTSFQHAYQAGFVAALLVVAVLALARLRQVLRSPSH